MHNEQRTTSGVPFGRRSFVAGAAALTAGIATGLRPAFADTQVVWVGWQGYDEPLKLGSFLADNGISLATTYINTNEEIITRLQAGGAGQTDLITIYFGHIPILVAADLLEPIDESKLPGIEDVFPEFLNVDVDPQGRQALRHALHLGHLVDDLRSGGGAQADLLEGLPQGGVQGQGRAGRRRDRAAGDLGADRDRHQDADPHHDGRAEEDRRLPDRDQEEPCPHPRQLLWRGDRHVRARRGGDVGDRLGRDGGFRGRQGQEARLRHSRGGRDGLHGYGRDSEGRAASRPRLQDAGAVHLGRRARSTSPIP